MIDRGTFVGLAAGAAAAGALQLRGAGGDPVPAYSALPTETHAGMPGVVVVMHVWGVDRPIRETVDMLAQHGFAAIAPDLYARWGAPDGDGATDYKVFLPFAQRLDPKQVDGDLGSAREYLRGKGAGNIALLGFCMGGGIVLNRTADRTWNAGAAFYGKLPEIDPRTVTMPVVGSYGEEDTGIPADQVRLFFDALAGPHDLKIYAGAGHAFCDTTRASYRPDAASDAWQRTIAFLNKYLRTS